MSHSNACSRILRKLHHLQLTSYSQGYRHTNFYLNLPGLIYTAVEKSAASYQGQNTHCLKATETCGCKRRCRTPAHCSRKSSSHRGAPTHLVMQNSRSPGTPGYRGRSPVAMINTEAEWKVSFPCASVAWQVKLKSDFTRALANF